MRVLAIDFGATSCRVVAVTLTDSLSIEEVHRFPTPGATNGGFETWDIQLMMEGVNEGIERAGNVDAIGVDSWGVDFVLLDATGAAIANPIRYRDPSHLAGFIELRKRMSDEQSFHLTGIQPLVFNSAFQLLARKLRNDAELNSAAGLAMLPDYIAQQLCMGGGHNEGERTAVSTSQLMSKNGDWSTEMLEAAEVRRELLPEIRESGTRVGVTKSGVPIFRVGAHDTASAFVACPAKNKNAAYISSGTWSCVGVEASSPVLTTQALHDGFTNESAVGGGYRFLRNVMGMWLLQRVQGNLTTIEAIEIAEKSNPTQIRFNVNDQSLLNPQDMRAAISKLAQHEFQNDSQLFRVIFENLAIEYATTIRRVEHHQNRKIRSVHIFGGGCQNRLLNRLTEEATGCPVIAGPVEATAIGNALVQLEALGAIRSATREGRELVAGILAGN